MTTIEGDLLEISSGVIFHQVNTKGVTGGLAGALKRKHPTTFLWYDCLCAADPAGYLKCPCVITKEAHSRLGCFRDLWVAHCFGQIDPGPNTDLQMVEKAFEYAVSQFAFKEKRAKQYPFYFPYKMGCGLGGGDWTEYRKLIFTYFPDATIVRKPGFD